MIAGQDGNGSRAASDGGVIDPLLTALTLVYINTTDRQTTRSSWPAQTRAHLNISILGTWCPTDSWQITSVALLTVTSSYEPPGRKLNQSYIWNTFFWTEATRYQVCCNISSTSRLYAASTKPAFPLRSWGWTNSISASRSLGSSRMAVCLLYPSLNKTTLD